MSQKAVKSVIIIDMDLVKMVNDAKKGDKTAFSQLFNLYYTPVYRYIISRSRDENLALDLSQEVFLRWYQSIDKYQLPVASKEYDKAPSPLSYLFTIAKRLMINQGLKKSSVAMPDDADEYIASNDVSATEIVDIQLDMEQVYGYFEVLTEAEREFIELKYLSELENKEISDIMSKSVDALRQIEYRALKKLRSKHSLEINNK